MRSAVVDVRYALRGLRRSPGFTAAAILTLALGIGANTAIFSLLDAVLLRKLPVENPDELFLVTQISSEGSGGSLSWPGFQRVRASLPAGAQMIAVTNRARFRMTASRGGNGPGQAQLVSGNYFSMLGVRPALGRVLTEADLAPGASPAAVLSHSAWVGRYARDAGTIGRVVGLNNALFTVVGVAEEGFSGVFPGETPDLWIPLIFQHDVRYYQNAGFGNDDPNKPWPPQESIRWLQAMARVSPPADVNGVAAALRVAFQREWEREAEGREDPREKRILLERGVALEPGARGFPALRRQLGTPLTVLMAMAGLVLLIACANIASLLMARGDARQREIAIRLSLGASRGRLARLLMTESLILGLSGGALGLLLAHWAAGALPALFAEPEEIRPDAGLFGFAFALALLTAVLFGLLPAVRGTRVNFLAALKSGGAGWRVRTRLGGALVIFQVALSLLLVSGSALLSRSLWSLLHIDPGFDRERVLTARIDPRAGGFLPKQLPDLYRRVVERVQAAPGIRAAGVSLLSIAGGGIRSSRIHVPGYTPGPRERPSAWVNLVEPGYFGIVGMRMLQGRDFNALDAAGAPRVAIVNEAMARRYFTGQNPLGRRFAYSPGHSGFEIVGIVRDARISNLREAATPMVYFPLRQEMDYARSLEVRVDGDARVMGAMIRKAVAEAAPDLPVLEVATLAERVDRTLASERRLTILTGSFALLSLLLACVGIYGLTSYRVARRTAEMGIRMALGARSADVVRLVLREAMTLVVAGLAVGVALGAAGARLIRSLLYEVSASDPATLAAAAAVMLLAALASAWIPARRASRIDPMAALRHE
jgi:predicted permease